MQELYERARHDPDAVDAFLRAVTPFVEHQVCVFMSGRNIIYGPDLIEAVAVDMLALIARKTPNKNIENICGFVVAMVRREAPACIDRYRRCCGLGPSYRTRRRRVAAGEPAYKDSDLRHKVEYRGGRDYIDENRADRRGVGVPAMLYACHRRGMPDEYWQFVAWVDETARSLAQPKLRHALSLIRTSRDEPILADVARLSGYGAKTLRYQLDGLAEQLVAIAPEWVRAAGRTYWRKSWPADAVNVAQSDFEALISSRGRQVA